jgi:hypothetical protein
MLAVLLTLVFVEQAEDLAGHLARGIIGGLLGDRDQPYAGALEPALVTEKLEQIAEEARAAMHDDRLIGRRVLSGIGNHLLEHRAPIIGRRRPGLDVLVGDRQTLRPAVRAQLAQLIGDRQVLLGLPGCRHPRIERYGHGVSSPLSGSESTSGGNIRSNSPVRCVWMSSSSPTTNASSGSDPKSLTEAGGRCPPDALLRWRRSFSTETYSNTLRTSSFKSRIGASFCGVVERRRAVVHPCQRFARAPPPSSRGTGPVPARRHLPACRCGA